MKSQQSRLLLSCGGLPSPSSASSSCRAAVRAFMAGGASSHSGALWAKRAGPRGRPAARATSCDCSVSLKPAAEPSAEPGAICSPGAGGWTGAGEGDGERRREGGEGEAAHQLERRGLDRLDGGQDAVQPQAQLVVGTEVGACARGQESV